MTDDDAAARSDDEDTYVCVICGGTFARDLSDELDAVAEAVGLFGDAVAENDLITVCDDCWQPLAEKYGWL